MKNQTETTVTHYHELGFSIFPLKPKSKEPAFGSWIKYQTARASLEQILKWWRNIDLNVAIVCGTISGIVVIDVDKEVNLPSDVTFPQTLMAKTARGHHYYYRLREGQKVKSSKHSWGEVRSDGNYVVAPYSVHPSGVLYEWVGCQLPSIEDMGFISEELLKQLRGNEESATTPKLYDSAFNGLVSEGARNSAMASVIGKLLKDFPNREEWPTTVWEIVKSINAKRCNPPLTTDELEKTFQSICRSETGPTQPKQEFTIVTGAEIVGLDVKQNPFLINGMIYERAINAITADSGKGKSIFALITAKGISTGEKLFDRYQAKKTKVLVIDQEMDADLIVERYKEIIGTEKPEVDYLFEQPWHINNPDDYAWLKKAITERGYGCVIFDTLTNIHTFDENKAEDMRELNKLLLRLIKETNVTIVYLHHHRKLQRGEKMNQSSSRGSTEIIAKVSSHILLDSKKSKNEKGHTVTSMTIKQSKSRRAEGIESITFDVVRDPIARTTNWVFRDEVKDDISAAQRATNEILALLKENGELTIQDMDELCSVGNTAIREACKILVNNNYVDFRLGGEGMKPNTKIYFLRKQDDY